MTDLEARVREALDAPCGKHDEIWHDCDGGQHRVAGGLRIRDCRHCLPQRIAAACEAYGCIAAERGPHEVAWTAALLALRGEL